MFTRLPMAARLFLRRRFVSSAGDWLGATAAGWFIAVELSGGSEAFAAARLMHAVAVTLFSSAAGPLIARRMAVSVLVASCMVAASASFLAAALALSYAHGRVSDPRFAIGLLWSLSFLAGASHAYRDGAEQRFQKELVPATDQHRLENAWTALFYFGRIVFGIVAGLLLSWLGVAVLFFLDGLTFLYLAAGALTAAHLLRMAPAARNGNGNGRRTCRAVLWDGLRTSIVHYWSATRMAVRRPDLVMLLWMLFVVEGIAFTAWNILPELVKRELGGDGFAYGVVICGSGAGGLVGTLIWGWVMEHRRHWGSILLVLGALVVPIGLLGVAASPHYLVATGCYALALLGWSWLMPPIRLYFRMDRGEALSTALLTLVLYGGCKVSQVLITLVLTHNGFSPSQELRASAGASLVLIVATFICFRRRLAALLAQMFAQPVETPATGAGVTEESDTVGVV